MRIPLLALISAAHVLACSCVGPANPCWAMNGSSRVFVARVLVDSGEGWGVGPARVLIEEPLWNAPKDLREVEVDTMAGSSCYVRLKAGERYIIFAFQKDQRPGHLSTGACSSTFPLKSNEHILDALRSQACARAARPSPSTQRL